MHCRMRIEVFAKKIFTNFTTALIGKHFPPIFFAIQFKGNCACQNFYPTKNFMYMYDVQSCIQCMYTMYSYDCIFASLCVQGEIQSKTQQVKQYKKQVDQFRGELDRCRAEMVACKQEAEHHQQQASHSLNQCRYRVVILPYQWTIFTYTYRFHFGSDWGSCSPVWTDGSQCKGTTRRKPETKARHQSNRVPRTPPTTCSSALPGSGAGSPRGLARQCGGVHKGAKEAWRSGEDIEEYGREFGGNESGTM